jgi:hypothetical protein
VDLDPNAKFEWPETAPGAGATDCQPGVYIGTFECFLATDPSQSSDFAVSVSGPISFTLVRSKDGEFLEIADGSLDGLAQLIFGFHCELGGQLDCSTLELTAMAVNGVWGFGDPSIVPAGAFAGDLTGTLDPTTGTLSGQWALTGDAVPGTCVGTWTTTRSP